MLPLNHYPFNGTVELQQTCVTKMYSDVIVYQEKSLSSTVVSHDWEVVKDKSHVHNMSGVQQGQKESSML